jgi:hypothetical protein
MKISTKVCLLLSVFFLSAACYAPKGCISCDRPVNLNFDPVLKLAVDTPELYNTDIAVMKHRLSGLIAFRRMSDSDTTRIVFLTETGMRMMEFSHSNGHATNTYSMDALKKNTTIKFMDSFIEMLLYEPQIRKTCCTISLNKSNYFCKLKKGSAEFEYIDNMKTRTYLQKNRKNTAEARYGLSPHLPDEINIRMKYHTKIQLKKVYHAFK